MTVYAGTIAGPYHVDRGQENQDAHWFLSEKGFTVIAVADGAGSLPRSGTGAEIAVSTAVNETLDDLIGGESIDEAVRCGVLCARKSLTVRDDSDETGCTLALAAFHENGGWAAATVGDAFVVITHEDGHHDTITSPKPTEYINITQLLTSKNIDITLLSGEDKIRAVSTASDGLAGTSLKDGGASDGFWDPVVKRATDGDLDVDSLLEYMNEQDRIEDDTTLVVAVPGSVTSHEDVLDDSDSTTFDEQQAIENELLAA